MPAISAVVATALAAGASEALKTTISQAIQDAYAGLKALIQKSYQSVNLTPLADDPASEGQAMLVKEALKKAGADDDKALLAAAEKLVDAIKKSGDPATAAAYFGRLRVEGDLEMEDIKTDGTSAIHVKEDAVIGKSLKIKNVDTRGRKT